ncbi:MAG: hypothetical protein IT302_00590 [Dehalococcoidia bacterium]|nr:hypothetical protein [Dehalococcoidia bacterium]
MRISNQTATSFTRPGALYPWKAAFAARAVILGALLLLAAVLPEAGPRRAEALDGFSMIAVAAGTTHTCAVTAAGGVKCWGSNDWGELGNGTNTPSLLPADVPGLTGVTAIAAGERFTCVLASGGVKCWGMNGFGQLGNGTTTPSNTPVAVTGLASGVTVLSTAHLAHMCAATATDVVCWGREAAEPTPLAHTTPVAVSGLGAGVTALSTGNDHSCAVDASGAALCWGGNEGGQLGNGTLIASATPVPVTGLGSGTTAIAAGAWHTCAIHGGAVKCWGANNNGTLGAGSPAAYSTTALTVSGISGATALDSRANGSCAVDSGAVKCWGANTSWEIGDGTMNDRPIPVTTIAAGASAVSSSFASCAIVTNGRLRCWGSNWSGAVGDGTTTNRPSPVNVVIPGMADHVAFVTAPTGPAEGVPFAIAPTVAVRDGTGATVTADNATAVTLSLEGSGTLTCTGGLTATAVNGVATFPGCAISAPGTVRLAASATDLGGGQSAQFVVVGAPTKLAFMQQPSGGMFATSLPVQPSVAVTDNGGTPAAGDSTTQVTLSVGSGPGTLTCTGGLTKTVTAGVAAFSGCSLSTPGTYVLHAVSNPAYTVADSTTFVVTGAAAALAFVKQPPFAEASVPMGVVPTVAVKDAGGNTVTTDNSTAVTLALTGPPQGKLICAGGLTRTVTAGIAEFPGCIVTAAGTGYILNATATPALTGAAGTAFDAVPGLAGGADHTCGVDGSATAMCWGWNGGDGRLGDGTYINRLVPTNVQGLGVGATAISVGNAHSCALTTGGGVKCWGWNVYSELGDGTNVNNSPVPVQVVGLAGGVIAIEAGGLHTCALLATGGVTCWGRGEAAALGNGANTNSNVPVNVTGMASGAAQVSAGSDHSCAVLGTGAIKCWGHGWDGQLGNGDGQSSNVPVAVSGASDYASVAAGTTHTCGLTRAGTVRCWGKNDRGQLGNGTADQALVPTPVVGLPAGVIAIAAGGDSSCAITAGAVLYCWGGSLYGAFGGYGMTAVPVSITGMTGARAVAVGMWHICARMADNSVRCAGRGGSGQLGDGQGGGSASPLVAQFPVPGTASRLEFTWQPSNGDNGAPLTIQPVVTVRDSAGTAVTGDSTTVVTLALTNPRGATLTCTGGLTRTVVQGMAVFSGCSVDLANTAYTLTATSSPALTAGVSAAFNVGAAPPSSVANLAAAATAGPGAHLTWTDGSPGTTIAFAVYRWKWGIGNPVQLAGVVPASQQYFDDSGLEPSTLYFYWVVASNLAGGTWSSAVQMVAAGGPPSAPSGLAATALSQSTVQVTWNDTSANELGFILFRTTTGPWEIVEWLPPGTASYLDTGRNPGTFYFYWVWSWGWNGFSTSPGITLALTYP